MRFQASLPLKFWGDCVLTATYIINRLPTPLLHHKSPYECLFHQPPDYDSLRVFGSLCFISTSTVSRGKFDARAAPCIFLGYPFGFKGYKVHNLYTGKCEISRDITFYEHIFPYASSKSDLSLPSSSTEQSSPSPFYEDFFSPHVEFLPVEVTPSPIAPSLNLASFTESDVNYSPSPVPPTFDDIPLPIAPARQSLRNRQPPGWLKDYVCSSTALPTADTTPCKFTSPYPMSSFLTHSLCSPSYHTFILNVSPLTEPSSLKEALSKPEWVDAMLVELKALEDNITWSLVPKDKASPW